MSDFQANIDQYDTLVGGANKSIQGIAPGTAGNALTHQGASTNPSYSDAVQGGMTLFEQIEASADSTVEFNGLETGRYILYVDDVVVSSSGNDLRIQFSNDNGSTWIATNYTSDLYMFEYGTTSIANNGAANTIWASPQLSTSTTQSLNATYNFANINSADYVFMYGDAIAYSTSLAGNVRCLISGLQNATTSIDAFRFIPTGGATITGTFSLFKLNY